MDKGIPTLLPCPFCGNDKVIFVQRPFGYAWAVECPSCYARGPSCSRQNTEPNRYGAWLPLEDETAPKKRAAESWNSNLRTPEMIKEWMDKITCDACGYLYHADELTETEYGRLCPGCFKEIIETEMELAE